MELQDLQEQLNRIEKKIDTLHDHFFPVKKKKKETLIKANDEEILLHIFEVFKKNINKRSRLIEKAKKKIRARLKEYKPEELKMAIERFSHNEWWMKNNAHRGIAWFFHSEERIEQFINLIAQKEKVVYELTYDNQPCKLFNSVLKIYTPWAGSWLEWNKNHPEYDKFVLLENKKTTKTGKEAYLFYIDHMKKAL